tara:strand:+ start:829 stop:1077 length:249 start_codon:yes stop_codon:yes gene_type:complete
MLKIAILNNLNEINKEKVNTKIFKYNKHQFKPSTIIDMTPLSYTFTNNMFKHSTIIDMTFLSENFISNIINNNKLFVIKEEV